MRLLKVQFSVFIYFIKPYIIKTILSMLIFCRVIVSRRCWLSITLLPLGLRVYQHVPRNIDWRFWGSHIFSYRHLYIQIQTRYWHLKLSYWRAKTLHLGASRIWSIRKNKDRKVIIITSHIGLMKMVIKMKMPSLVTYIFEIYSSTAFQRGIARAHRFANG